MAFKYSFILLALCIGYCSAQAGLIPIDAPFNADTFCKQISRDGNYPFPNDCSKFASCTGDIATFQSCSADLFYNPASDNCVFQKDVECLHRIAENVCYKAKDSGFGHFTIPRSGTLRQLTLQHKSGFVSCDASNSAAESFWGCGLGFRSVQMATVVTRQNNTLLFPFFALGTDGYYGLARTDFRSRTLTLYNFDGEIQITKGEKIRIWHGEDLVNQGEEGNNSGEHCVDVWAVLKRE
ncbi:uncharacterized protein [Clytia hemisphaerica]|uniref:Chitin-binding type-2 domain-containing protein n=1 Tax=Clytia hemisphaerica TaxID=252671 RepID=A0A7M5V1Q9_9CNID